MKATFNLNNANVNELVNNLVNNPVNGTNETAIRANATSVYRAMGPANRSNPGNLSG